MSRCSSHDHYLDLASGVLKNRLGITDAATPEKGEAALVATRSYQLAQTPLKGRFDLTHLQAIHRYLFGDLHEWGGKSWTEKPTDRKAQSVVVVRAKNANISVHKLRYNARVSTLWWFRRAIHGGRFAQ
jgi:cell filamentation protein